MDDSQSDGIIPACSPPLQCFENGGLNYVRGKPLGDEKGAEELRRDTRFVILVQIASHGSRDGNPWCIRRFCV
jgi:hypothetical protein